jgi:hypothetical protein
LLGGHLHLPTPRQKKLLHRPSSQRAVYGVSVGRRYNM